MLEICVINTNNRNNYWEKGGVKVKGFGSFEYSCTRFSKLFDLEAISRVIKKSDVVVIEALELTHYSEFSTAFYDQRMQIIISDAIGCGKQLILAPYTKPEHYFGNATIKKEVLGIKSDCYNVTVLQPELVYNGNKEVAKVIPASENEILDTICKIFMVHNQHWVEPTPAMKSAIKYFCRHYFKKMAKEIDGRKYYGDCQHDNFIAMKFYGGILCTNLHSNFNSLKPKDLIFVTDWRSGVIEWTGIDKNSKINYKLPLIIELFEKYPGRPAMISAGYNILNNNLYVNKVYTTKEYVLAGLSGQVDKVAEKLEKNDGIAVMKQNSSIIMSQTFKGASDRLVQLLYDATII